MLPTRASGAAPLFVKQRFPVGWDPSSWSRHRLIDRMALRRGQARARERFFRAIVVEPPLTRLEGHNDRMTRLGMMF
jgi:hypothetical protein